MSSFKKADGIIDSIQKQATGLRTLDGSAIEDFLSIAGYEDPQGGGGGGDSDFSTATVTITKTETEHGFTIICPNIFNDELFNTINEFDLPGDFEIVLYKGQGILEINGEGEYALNVTGDIEAEYGGSAVITGDGTIEITETPGA